MDILYKIMERIKNNINKDIFKSKKNNQLILLENEKKYNSILNNVKEIIFQVNKEGQLTFLNKPWEEITGFNIEESLGKLIFDYIHPDNREICKQKFIPLINRKKDFCRTETKYLTKDGGYKWVEIYSRLTLDEDDNVIGMSGTINDITERKNIEFELEKHKNNLEDLVKERTQKLNFINDKLKGEIIERKKSEEKLEYLATHDYLTSIPNRYYLNGVLEEVLKNNNENALLFIDLDNFKVINDTYGHKIGDLVLINLVDIFRKHLRSNDILARLGGDEFAILLKNINMEEVRYIAEQIRFDLDTNDIYVQDTELIINITTSIGIVKIDKQLDPQELLSYADTALYAAKYNGKNKIVVIESYEDKNKLSQTNKIVQLIKEAIRDNKFILYYQPVYKMNNGIIHYEALIRMLDDNNKIILPNNFIPIAERFGLMSQIDKWVIKTTLDTLQKHEDMKIFVNISGINMGDKAILQFIEDNIKISNINPSRIGFEITETTAIRDLAQSSKWIKKLKDIGCKFALDDFGVGFSSFSYLSNLPIDYLKIDGSFIKDLNTNPTQIALIQAMNAVAHALGKETIAEFIENEDILKILRELNVDHGQGFYLGKPTEIKK